MTDSYHSPSAAKRIKLEVEDIPNPLEGEADNDLSKCADVEERNHDDDDAKEDGENCSICLQALVDRTVIPKCSHEFCFECLRMWTEQSRRCPLCSQDIGDYLIHSIRSRYDYRKHYLPPLRTSPLPSRPAHSIAITQSTREFARRRRRERVDAYRRDNNESDKLERSIQLRRWIYRYDVYAKHVASNSFTKYRPYPTPAQFSASQDLISRTTTFLRRELQVWEGLDIEFLTTLIISLMKSIDIRSESAVKLIAEFLDMDAPYTPGGRHVNAEHFAHEMYCYVRSPYKDLFVYDSIVQYETPRGASPPPTQEQDHRPQTSSSHDHFAPCYTSRQGTSQVGPSTAALLERNRSPFPNSGSYDSSTRKKTSEMPEYGASMSLHRYEGSRNDPKSGEDGVSRKPTKSSDDHRTSNSSGRNTTRSSSVDLAEQSNHVAATNTKGKEKAYDIDTLPEQDGGRDIENLDVPPPEQNMRNDVDQSVPGSSKGPQISKSSRPLRNKSLLESVKAHLALNHAPTALTLQNTNEVTKRGVQDSQAQVLMDGRRSHDCTQLTEPPFTPNRHPSSNDGINVSRGGKNIISGDLIGHKSSTKKQDMSNRHLFVDPRSSEENLNIFAQGLDPGLKINGTRLKSRPIEETQVISALNMINGRDTNTTGDIVQPSASPTSPPKADSHSLESAAGSAGSGRATYHLTDGDCNNSVAHHNKKKIDEREEEADLLIIHPISHGFGSGSLPDPASSIANGQHVSPMHASHASFPFGRVGHVKPASITQHDRSLPISHSFDTRTRLLARLELEKTRARDALDQQESSNSCREDTDLCDTQVPPALLAAEMSTSSTAVQPTQGVVGEEAADSGAKRRRGHSSHGALAPFDRGNSREQSNTANLNKRSQGDLESAHVDDTTMALAEEARAKEAKLRLRAQLRCRLAAERRLAG